MRIQKIYFVAALALTVLSACSKNENPVNSGNNNQTGTTEMGGNVYPSAIVTDVTGMFGTVNIAVDYGVPQIPPMNTVFGISWLKEGSPAGITVNEFELESKGQTQGGTMYMSVPLIGEQASELPFDGSAHNWTIQGGTGIQGFQTSVTTPYGIEIIRPMSQSNVSKSGFTVQWNDENAVNSSDLYFLSIYNQGKRINIMDLSASGSRTITASELSGFAQGQLQIQLGKVRYKIVGQGGKNYSVFAEYLKQNAVMLQ